MRQRARTHPWRARERPVPDKRVALYASWNGATKVSIWEVLAGPSASQLETLGSVPRDDFETAMLAQTSDPYLAVRAKDRFGEVLGTSAAVEL